MNSDYFYTPREDTALILKQLKKFIKPDYKVLEIGTGSGILAKEASKYAKEVIACDINKKLIKELKEKNKRNKNRNKIRFTYSDLFLNINSQKFNLIIFNPPYLPSKEIIDKRIDGGKNGTQIIEKFLKKAKQYLKKDGQILLLCSSLNKNIEGLFRKYKYKFKKIDEKKMFFEKLYVYELFMFVN